MNKCIEENTRINISNILRNVLKNHTSEIYHQKQETNPTCYRVIQGRAKREV